MGRTFVGDNEVPVVGSLQQTFDPAAKSFELLISTSYLDSSSYATQANTTGVKLGTDILTKYAPSLLPSWKNGDANVMYGLAQGWTFVNAYPVSWEVSNMNAMESWILCGFSSDNVAR